MKNLIPFLFIMLFLSCQEQKNESSDSSPDPAGVKEPLVKANQHLVRNEDQLIDAYISRYQVTMQRTGSGLRYSILKKSNGRNIKAGDRIEIKYTLTLLDGSLCYTSEKDGPIVMTLGKAEVNSGLDEGILLMKEGEQAKIIVPSHLGFGLLGDGSRIPARSALVYQINNIKVISR